MNTQEQKTTEVLTQAEALRLFSYDPVTGIVTRNLSTASIMMAGDVVGCAGTRGYLVVSVNGRRYRLHRVIWLMVTGGFPDEKIDHINGDTSDNRFENIRAVTQSENTRNRRICSRNKSGVMGVSWCKRNQKWITNIKAEGKNKHLGYFDDIEDAKAARTKANIKYGFHQNHGRSA